MAGKSSTGICYIAGAGPGDPGLVTLKVKECLETADVIVYDYLCNLELLDWARVEAEVIFAGKKASAHTLTQAEISALLVERTLAGKRVVRLKGGDPCLFGRGGEEAEALAAAGLRFEILPGISSALAGPVYAGIPVTHRGHTSQVTIFTGHEDPLKPGAAVDYQAIARMPGTKIMLMGMERLEAVASSLLEHGAAPDLPVALVRWATTARQQTVKGTLRDIAALARDTGLKAPAVAVFGEVVSLRDSLKWFEDRPLFGRRVVVTRARKQAGALSTALRDLGAEVLEIPTIRIEPPEDLLEFGELVQDAHRYDWLVFTSSNGVDAFFGMFYRIYDDAREIGGARIAAIGPGTAERLRAFHLKADLRPETSVAEGLVKAFQKQEGSVENLRILIVQATEARDVLSRQLSELGAIVDTASAYRTVPETGGHSGALARFREDGADLITFTSSSTVENFLALNLPLPERMLTASIGPITSATMRERGLKVDMEAERHDIAGLSKVIREFLEP